MATEITRPQPYGSVILELVKGSVDDRPLMTRLHRVQARNVEACAKTYHHLCQGVWYKFFFFNIRILSLSSLYRRSH